MAIATEMKWVITSNGGLTVTESMEFFEAKDRLKKLYDYYKEGEKEEENEVKVSVLGERSFAAWVGNRTILFEMLNVS